MAAGATRHCAGRWAAAVALLAMLACGGAADTATAASAKLRMRLAGGTVQRLELCGRETPANVVDEGDRAAARIRRPLAASGRPRAVVTVESCRNGAWERVDRVRVLGIAQPGWASLHYRARLDTGTPGDYRVRAVVGRTRIGFLYLRVGVGEIVDLPVRFDVRNANTSRVPCSSDGAEYRLAGTLVGPRSELDGGRGAVTLYLHGLGYGEFFWRFGELESYDYAVEQAGRGDVSVVVDRLGYDASSHPPGTATCLGAQADMAHQVIGQLRNGQYGFGGGAAPVFKRVALAGHSIGGAIAEIEASSWDDADAVIVMAFADRGSSQRAIQEAVRSGQVCGTGGEPAEPGEPSGYAYYGQSPDDFRGAMFHNAEPAAVERATALRNRDPCGDHSSIPQTVFSAQDRLADIKVPVLIVCAENDTLFPPEGCQDHRGLFTGSSDVTTTLLEDTGHAVTLERTRERLRTEVSAWLRQRGF
jgi:pimeloyl-ACP methyl ester carboxylesterase